MLKKEKPLFVDNLTENLKSATSVVLVNYSGLSVKKQQQLKKALKPTGARVEIVKNTLFKRAGEKAKISAETLEDSVLSGPTAMIIGDRDPIAPLQALYKFVKENEIPQLKVGLIEGNFQDKDSLEKLAKLPSKEILFGQVVGTIAGPMYGIVSTLQANIQKLLYILKSKAQG